LRRAVFFSALIAGLITSLAAVAAGPVSGTIEAHKVIVGESGEEFRPADEARPTDVIEYRLKYANNGSTSVRNLSVVDPIPAGVAYVGKSAIAPKSGAVEFSIDNGKSYHAWPVRYKTTDANGREVEREATAGMVTHIRWTLSGDLAPEHEMDVSYRATVK